MDLPIVNFKSTNFRQDFFKNFKKYTFCLIVNYPDLNQQFINQFYDNYHIFFNSYEKNNFYYNKKIYDGFVPIEQSEQAQNSKIKDYKEFFHYYPWGRNPDFLTKISSEMFNRLKNIANKFMHILADNLPKEINIKNKYNLTEIYQSSAENLLRTSYYPVYSQETYNSNRQRAAEHYDINLLTVQPTASIPGLECRLPDNTWQCVDNINAIFIGAGEMLTELTYGFYKPCFHRVASPSKKNNLERLSTMFFLHPRSTILLKPETTASIYLKKRLVELGLLEVN